MRVTQAGSTLTVTVSADEVEQFNRRWPCSTLPVTAIAFEFDNRNGDLVGCPDNVDGPEAVALSQDAWKYATSGGVVRVRLLKDSSHSYNMPMRPTYKAGEIVPVIPARNIPQSGPHSGGAWGPIRYWLDTPELKDDAYGVGLYDGDYEHVDSLGNVVTRAEWWK